MEQRDIMIKFVVYDDEEVFRSNVVKSIDKIMSKSKLEYCIEEFAKYNSKMQKTIDEDIPKIYIMDIEIPNGLSGIDVARRIRNNDWNSDVYNQQNHKPNNPMVSNSKCRAYICMDYSIVLNKKKYKFSRTCITSNYSNVISYALYR